MIYECFFNKSMFQKPCPLISSLRPNVAPAATSSRCVSLFSPHRTPTTTRLDGLQVPTKGLLALHHASTSPETHVCGFLSKTDQCHQ
ncbi:hypothetical protein QQF64_001921 [Cirrhinus molitorella]|uniref:Uncharacterized protein n=1 Tax=Cirrhinus molitorella TaxID=172907 RepID=A0ABR3MNN8_9TELE